jgi:hypothetical protein
MMFELQTKEIYQDCIRKPAFKSAFKLEFGHMTELVDDLTSDRKQKEKQQDDYVNFMEKLLETPDFEEKLKLLYGDFEILEQQPVKPDFVTRHFVIPMSKWKEWVANYTKNKVNMKSSCAFPDENGNVHCSFCYYLK